MKSSMNKFLLTAVILLFVVNISMLVYILQGRKSSDSKREGGKGGPFEMMVKDLGMSEQQQKDYQQLKDEHFKRIRPIADSIRAAKQAYFNLVKEPNVSDSALDYYDGRIRLFQLDADKMTFNHFRAVRNLFNPEQQRKYDSIIQKMMQRSPGWRRDSTNKDKH